MAKKLVKLVDIAKELNVSVGLVSLVLSGKAKEQRISDAIANKVLKKSNEMGYKANQLARGLRTGRSGIIGLIVADIANPYFGKMARNIENEAARLNYQIMIGSSDENVEKLEQLIDLFQSRQVDGVIIVPVAGCDKIIKSCQQRKYPVVLIDRYCKNIEEDFVCTDNYNGALALTQVLLNNGYKKIASFVYNLEVSNNLDRVKGYQKAIDKNGSQNKESIYEVNYTEVENKLEPVLMHALEIGCDGFFFANNNLGIESLKILDKLDLKVGKDIGFVSFDNPETYHMVKPSITCYQQPIKEMSLFAVQHLVKKLKEPIDRPIIRQFIEGDLIVRDSC